MRVLALAAVLTAGAAAAAGAAKVGWLPVDELTPDAICAGCDGTSLASRANFNAASREEILRLTRVLAPRRGTDPAQERWLRETRARLVANYLAASSELPDAQLTWDELVEKSASGRREFFNSEHREFWETWVAEQLRLAQLFPRPTSEVFPLDESDVMATGRDLEFSLTFDDGPTPAGGTTDETLKVLRWQQLPATFFVLGEQLAKRADAKELYGADVSTRPPFCVASHGTSHVAHDKLESAKSSVTQAAEALVKSGVQRPRVDLFRPPYGQRGPGVAPWLAAEGVRSVLWNIDSQDWRSDAKPRPVAGRVIALMLVQRRGVILFHDVHPVAHEAVRLINGYLQSAVSWSDCAEWQPLARPDAGVPPPKKRPSEPTGR